ncbi:REP-associated tyrosine transposase [Pontiella agarivorans]|uniref:Transposase n=1 Tax=Pontiella agarivorans TaxID=3038953 RepID=A0ABU5MUR5_9BACT|nr:transposase [Pontiella agarivorans]MDZ8117933.1 transposase [Pontiella agarivorans]
MEQRNKFYDRRRPAHQSTVDRFNSSRIIFLTVCAEKRKPIFAGEQAHRHILASWIKADAWVVGRYMIMPDHIHLFCSPVGMEYPSLKTWVNYWKSLSARTWPEKHVGKVWQRDFWDTRLRKGDSYTEKWNYVENNPVRAGLVTEADFWPYQGEICGLQWHE